MKTRNEIQRELEDRKQRIKMISTFGDGKEVDYERGYVHCLEWTLRNYNQLSRTTRAGARADILYEQLLQSSGNLDQDEGVKAAWSWIEK